MPWVRDGEDGVMGARGIAGRQRNAEERAAFTARVLELRADDLPTSVIAERLGCSQNLVEVTLRRARDGQANPH